MGLNGESFDLPEFITFNKNSREFIIMQKNTMKAGVYKIQVDGYMKDFPDTKTYIKGMRNTTLEIICDSEKIVPEAGKIIQYKYIMGETPLVIKIKNFTQNPPCNREVVYKVQLDNGLPLP